MNSAFRESPTPEPETTSDTELAPETEGETETELASEPDTEVADAELVDAEGDAGADPGVPGEGDDGASSSMVGDLSGLEALLSDDFARISAERDQYFDSLQRLKADFDNFRKRTERQQAQLRDRANEVLLTRLLPVLDALDLALAHLGLENAPPADEASASLVQVNTLLRDILQREGLERIDAVGVPFDPTVHDATAMDDNAPAGGGAAPESGTADDGSDVSDDDVPPGPTVSEVWRAGYRLNDRVIRPAMVRVRG